MRENGVTIETHPSVALIEALKASAVKAQAAWCSIAGAACEDILSRFGRRN